MTQPLTVISNERLDSLLAASPAERVTKDAIESRISECKFTRIGLTVTLCSVLVDNGFSVRGESACVNPENYNQEIGEKIAYDDAFRKLWPLFGFLLSERNKLKADALKEAA